MSSGGGSRRERDRAGLARAEGDIEEVEERIQEATEDIKKEGDKRFNEAFDVVQGYTGKSAPDFRKEADEGFKNFSTNQREFNRAFATGMNYDISPQVNAVRTRVQQAKEASNLADPFFNEKIGQLAQGDSGGLIRQTNAQNQRLGLTQQDINYFGSLQTPQNRLSYGEIPRLGDIATRESFPGIGDPKKIGDIGDADEYTIGKIRGFGLR